LCLIIDANKTADFLNKPSHPDHVPIYAWIESGRGMIPLGGQLAREILRIRNAQRYFRELLRAGRARRYPDERVDADEAAVRDTGLCVSDDPHVIALARVSGARVLFSEDRDLWDDFRNPQLVPRPVGKIYRRAEHVAILREARPCRQVSDGGAYPDVAR
jgi:hypothetical protein